uniref:ADF-H domain-containing protein n=1 Tax=Trichuris muris TaxID=70415 RepID=A0A5S6PZ01_TRIMR
MLRCHSERRDGERWPQRSVIFKASGVKIDPQCKKDYDDMHSRKMYSYLIFRISDDDTTIIVEKKGQRGASYKEFQDELAKAIGSGKECRYGCVDVEFAVQRQGTESTSSIQKVVFVQLCPDDAPVRKRMLYASSVRGLKSCLGLESLMQIQASDISDLDEKAIKHELMTHQRV